jgi:hypothetical protein
MIHIREKDAENRVLFAYMSAFQLFFCSRMRCIQHWWHMAI